VYDQGLVYSTAILLLNFIFAVSKLIIFFAEARSFKIWRDYDSAWLLFLILGLATLSSSLEMWTIWWPHRFKARSQDQESWEELLLGSTSNNSQLAQKIFKSKWDLIATKIFKRSASELTFRALLDLYANKVGAVQALEDAKNIEMEAFIRLIPQLGNFILHSEGLYNGTENLQSLLLSISSQNVHLAHRFHWFLLAFAKDGQDAKLAIPTLNRQDVKDIVDAIMANGKIPGRRIKCGNGPGEKEEIKRRQEEDRRLKVEKFKGQNVSSKSGDLLPSVADLFRSTPTKQEPKVFLGSFNSDVNEHMRGDADSFPPKAISLDVAGLAREDHTETQKRIETFDVDRSESDFGPSFLTEEDPYGQVMRFIERLTGISWELMNYEKAERKDELRKRLQHLQEEMLSKPSRCLYVPVGNVYHRIHQIHVEESFPFSTKERVPFLVCFEVVDYASDHGGGGVADLSNEKGHDSSHIQTSFVGRFKGEFNVTLGKRKITLRVGDDGDDQGDVLQRVTTINGTQGENVQHEHGPPEVQRSQGPEVLGSLEKVGEDKVEKGEKASESAFQSRNDLQETFGSGLDASMWSTRSTIDVPFRSSRPRSFSNDGSAQSHNKRRTGFQLGPVFVYSLLETTRKEPVFAPSQRSMSYNGSSFDSLAWNVPKTNDLKDDARITIPFRKFQLKEIFKKDKATEVDTDTDKRNSIDKCVSALSDEVISSPKIKDVTSSKQDEKGGLDHVKLERHDSGASSAGLSVDSFHDDQDLEYDVDNDDDIKSLDTELPVPMRPGKSDVVFRERWAEKEKRIAKSSPYSHMKGWRLLPVIVKANDDLRQEQFCSQLIKQFQVRQPCLLSLFFAIVDKTHSLLLFLFHSCLFMQEIFTESGHPLWLSAYDIVATGPSCGVIEAVPDSISIDALRKNDPDYTSLRDFFIRFHGKPSSKSFKVKLKPTDMGERQWVG
jgi:hypothetical protein